MHEANSINLCSVLQSCVLELCYQTSMLRFVTVFSGILNLIKLLSKGVDVPSLCFCLNAGAQDKFKMEIIRSLKLLTLSTNKYWHLVFQFLLSEVNSQLRGFVDVEQKIIVASLSLLYTS